MSTTNNNMHGFRQNGIVKLVSSYSCRINPRRATAADRRDSTVPNNQYILQRVA